MLPRRTLAMLISASLSAGCAIGPDYVRPDMPLPERYLGQAAVDQRHATASADLVAWWTGFGDPQLTRFVILALEQNLDLAQAPARVAQARAGLGAANAALLPSGNINGQAARTYQSVETPLGQVLDSTPDFDRYGNACEVNLGASWELDLFGGLRRGREAALAEYQASEADATATQLAVAAQAVDIYISIRGLQARLDVAHWQVQTQQDLLSTVNLLYGKGLAAEYQRRQVEGALAQVQASVPVLETGLDATMNVLDVMPGSSPGTYRVELAEVGAIPVAPQIVATGSPGELLRRRPDWIAAERRLAVSNARIGVAIAEYYPKLSLSGLIGSATSVSGGSLFSNCASQAAGMLGLRWRLFDSGCISAQIHLARGQEAEVLACLSACNRGRRKCLLGSGQARGASYRTRPGSLGRVRGASFAAYQKGVVSLIEVLKADEDLLHASDARAQAQTESVRVGIAVFKALDGGWQSRKSETVATG